MSNRLPRPESSLSPPGVNHCDVLPPSPPTSAVATEEEVWKEEEEEEKEEEEWAFVRARTHMRQRKGGRGLVGWMDGGGIRLQLTHTFRVLTCKN